MIFGLPGDGIMESLRERQDSIRFIQVRHEESAAFMACGYAKYPGKLGVCLATSGPGGIHHSAEVIQMAINSATNDLRIKHEIETIA